MSDGKAKSVVAVDAAGLPRESWDDPARGTLTWQTLLSGGRTASDSMVCGIADMQPGQHFAAHRHAQAEVYFGLEGEGEVVIDGIPHRLAPGIALYIPGWAEHGVPCVTQPLRWFYTFACDSFDQITYHFTHEAGPAPDQRPR